MRIVPQARAGIVERFGKYKATLPAGLNIVVPFVDRVRYMIDLREQVVSFPPQPVITEDNLVVSIDTVIYFQVTNAVSATYEIANYIQAVEQLTMTTLRNIVGGMDLEQTLTSREDINAGLRTVLDEATGKWGIRVNRVEIKGIDPPPSIKDAMEKQMRADRDKRAVVLTAEGQRQSAILTAEGNKQSAILNAEGQREAQILAAEAERQARILRAQGEGQAIQTVFQAIHDGQPDQSLLAYQYLQMLPKIAEGDANKVWIVPSEIGRALEGLGSSIGQIPGIPKETDGAKHRVDMGEPPASPTTRRLDADVQARAAVAGGDRSGQRRAAVAGAAAARPTPATPAAAGPRRLRSHRHVTPLGARRHRPRGRGGRFHQRRSRVGNARHVPDPAGVRRAAGDRERLEQHRAGPRCGQRGDRLAPRARRAAHAARVRLASASLVGGVAGAVLLLVLPAEAFGAVVPVLVGLGIVLVAVQPLITRRVAAAVDPDARRPGAGRLWLWPAVGVTGVYGGFFGAAQGILLMAVLGLGTHTTLHRNNALKNVLAGIVNGVAAVVFIAGRRRRLADRRRSSRSARSSVLRSARGPVAGCPPPCCAW